MSYSTGNLARDAFIVRAIEQVRSEPKPTPLGVGTVSRFLPAGFDLDADELSGILSTLPAAPTNDAVTFDDADDSGGNVPFDPASGMAVQPIRQRKIARVSESLENIEAPRAPESEQPHNDAAKSPAKPITAEQMAQVMGAAQRRLENARINVRVCTGELQAKRAALAKAIASWQSGQPVVTWESNARAHVQASQAARAARVAAGGPSTSATARAFLQKRMQNGPNRGAFTQAQRARFGFRDPRYIPPKVPSER
jgi:hypothetical protein